MIAYNYKRPKMYIDRIQVEDGFLDGMDVQFTSGLNVIIGARGTGKTSLIELLRFCLDASANTPEAARRSRDHALSILGPGQVTVTLVSEGQKIMVTRTAQDPAPRFSAPYVKPIVFSQTEIETVGLEASGRLKLLDGFLDGSSMIDVSEEEARAQAHSLTLEAEKIRRQIDDIEKQLEQLPLVNKELADVSIAEAQVAQTSSALDEKVKRLSAFSSTISANAVLVTKAAQAKESIGAWYAEIKNSQRSIPAISTSENPTTLKPLEQFPPRIAAISVKIQQAMDELAAIYHEIDSVIQSYTQGKVQVEDQARQLRKEVDDQQTGTGNILRRAQELRERKAKLESLKAFLDAQNKALGAVLASRGRALDKLDEIRSQRFNKRMVVANRLNAELGPNIHISLLRNGQTGAFAAAIADVLRGSGLRYADLSTVISQQLSPRALLEAVDAFDFELISETAEISIDRASRILSHLRGADLGSLCTMSLEDEVTLQLLDGCDYKELSELSTGQRCTVVLPLVLAHTGRMLIVDQPEDHIDNAFIADTLIKVVIGRDERSQIIFSTHNPNIPVLGDANMVLHLGSDGRRGFKMAAGPLDDHAIVNAISSVMEGGAKAFSRRASFYSARISS